MPNKLENTLFQSFTRVKSQIAAVCVASVMWAAVPLQASATQGEHVSVRVDISQIDQQDGVATVYTQLTQEAQMACTPEGFQSLIIKKISEKCTKNLLNDFIVDLDIASLTSYHNAHK